MLAMQQFSIMVKNAVKKINETDLIFKQKIKFNLNNFIFILNKSFACVYL